MRNSFFIPLPLIIIPLFFLLIVFVLSSCSTPAHDGAPNFYVDETKIPNATPKPGPLSKYGNQPSYVVFGKRYYVMRSSKNYDEVGIASWYGTAFHARHTSNGERYNMLAMTAAHKTLPLPTYVEVTNLRNHRKIIVKINDRGPFAPNRIIDLSYVAAKKLHMIGTGTTLVRVRAIDPYQYQHLIAQKEPVLANLNHHHSPTDHHAFIVASAKPAYVRKTRSHMTHEDATYN